MGYVANLRIKVGNDPLILTGANVIVVDGNGKILMQQRSTGSWGLPGGQMEYGESLEQAAAREVYEETGLRISESSLVQLHTFSGNDYEFTLPNGDQISAVTTLFISEQYEGNLHSDDKETKKLMFCSPYNLPTETEPEYKRYVEFYLESVEQD